MQRLLLLAASTVLSTVAIAQSPLTTLFAQNNSGSVGGAVYFDLTTTPAITITSIGVNLISAASTPGSIEVWTVPVTRLGNQTNQALWTMVGTGTVIAAGAGLPSTVTLSGTIPLPAATTFGVAFRAIGVALAYTNGTGANQNYSTAELALAAGEATNVPFTAPLFTPRVVNCSISYILSGGGTFAQRVPYGTGVAQFASGYENFATSASFDLNGANFEYSERAAGGWDIGVGPGPVSAAGAAPYALTDDSEVTQALSSGFAASLNVCSNGFFSVNGSNGTGFTPSVATMLGAANEAWWVWHDFNPASAGSGQVKYQFLGGEDVFTFDGVHSFGTTVPNTFQVRFSGTTPNRRVRCCFVQMSGVGNAVLVAYSPAGASLDPGNTDISAAGPVTLAAADSPALAVTSSARPLIGTSVTLDTTNIRAGTLAGVTLMSGIQNLAGLDLGFLGATGNRFYLGSIDLTLPMTIAGSSGSTPAVAIPNLNSLLGGAIYWQSVTVTPGANPLSVLTSNGLCLILGNL